MVDKAVVFEGLGNQTVDRALQALEHYKPNIKIRTRKAQLQTMHIEYSF